MDGLDTLTSTLAQRTPDRLAALLARHAEPLSRRPAPTRLRELSAALWSYETLHQLVPHLDLPSLQVLAATAGLSRDRARNAAPGPAAPRPGADYQSLMAHRLSFPDLAAEPVPVTEIYAALLAEETECGPGPESGPGAGGRTGAEGRAAVDQALRALYEGGFAAPTEDGRVVVPPRAVQLLSGYDLGPFAPIANPASLGAAPTLHHAAPTPHHAVPAPVGAVRASPGAVRAECQAAVSAFAGAVDRLLASLATQPAALRKSKAGGLAVREIKRLAKAAGTTEPRTRLLLDLALAADLIALTRTPSGTTALPTGTYDDWLALPPGERLLPVLTAWAGLWSIPTWTPFGETPTALVRGHDRYAPALRYALLAALATHSDGDGIALPAPDAPSLEALRPLLATARRHRPLAVIDEPMILERTAHTLDEAVALGLIAYGGLTPLGHAVLDAVSAPTYDGLCSELRALLPPPLEQAHFQGDLSAIVPGPPSTALSALLALTADRESEDSDTAWRFSAASLRRALDAGHTGDTLLADLTAVSAAGPLPHQLSYLIKDTDRTHGRMRVVRAGCCIRSDDETLIRELAAHRDLRALGLRAIAPTVLVSAEAPEPTLDALRAAGYAPALEAETGTTVLERTPSHRARTPARKPADHLALARRLLAGEACPPAHDSAPSERQEPEGRQP